MNEVTREAVMAELRKTFRPEFLNRVDEIVVFHALDKKAYPEDRRHPARTVCRTARGRSGYRSRPTNRQRSFSREKGYDPVYGARPLKRAIQRELETPLSRMIIAGEVKEGSGVKVTAKGEDLVLTVKK